MSYWWNTRTGPGKKHLGFIWKNGATGFNRNNALRTTAYARGILAAEVK